MTESLSTMVRLHVKIRTNLVQLQRHPHCRRQDGLQQRHVGENPLVAGARYAEVAFEQRVQAVQEEFHAVKRISIAILFSVVCYNYKYFKKINLIFQSQISLFNIVLVYLSTSNDSNTC